MRKMSWLIKSCVFLFICAIVGIIGLYTFAYISPKIELKTANQFSIYNDNDELVFQGSGSNEWVNIDEISKYLIDAVVSTEDRSFYSHKGFDYLRIAKAMANNITSGDIVEGASTISQQYIKNMFLSFDQTWNRKVEEAFLTLKLEVHYNKEEILEGYLNTINYGNGNYGIQNASRYYFNKDASDLTLEESAILAGIPKNPSNYNPVADYDKSIYRAKIVIKAMIDNEVITEEDTNGLFKEEIEIYGKREQNNLQTLMYYQDAVINELKSIKDIPNSLITSGGLKIYTNLSIDAQTALEDAVVENMSGSDLQIASVIINPKTGAITALTGGYNYATSQYNRATQSLRQVGSTIKPLLYYAALENGFTSSTTFSSEPTTFTLAGNQSYSPQNYNENYGYKNITMAAAIAYSENIYAMKTHMFLGEDMLVDTATRMGINKKLQAIPSLPLGTDEMNIIDFAHSYTTLASGGYQRDLFFIRKVEDVNGNILYEHKEETNLVLNLNYTYILNELLTSTYNGSFVDYNTPSALAINSNITHKYAVKTGSTDTDFWMVGYNPDILMLVWNGKDDSSKLDINDSMIPKKIWYQTVEKILERTNSEWYETPENVVGVILDAVTGEYTSNTKKAVVYYYLKGTEPGTVSVSKEEKEKK